MTVYIDIEYFHARKMLNGWCRHKAHNKNALFHCANTGHAQAHLLYYITRIHTCVSIDVVLCWSWKSKRLSGSHPEFDKKMCLFYSHMEFSMRHETECIFAIWEKMVTGDSGKSIVAFTPNTIRYWFSKCCVTALKLGTVGVCMRPIL